MVARAPADDEESSPHGGAGLGPSRATYNQLSSVHAPFQLERSCAGTGAGISVDVEQSTRQGESRLAADVPLDRHLALAESRPDPIRQREIAEEPDAAPRFTLELKEIAQGRFAVLLQVDRTLGQLTRGQSSP
jgi:hypothetical protein